MSNNNQNKILCAPVGNVLYGNQIRLGGPGSQVILDSAMLSQLLPNSNLRNTGATSFIITTPVSNGPTTTANLVITSRPVTGKPQATSNPTIVTPTISSQILAKSTVNTPSVNTTTTTNPVKSNHLPTSSSVSTVPSPAKPSLPNQLPVKPSQPNSLPIKSSQIILSPTKVSQPNALLIRPTQPNPLLIKPSQPVPPLIRPTQPNPSPINPASINIVQASPTSAPVILSPSMLTPIMSSQIPKTPLPLNSTIKDPVAMKKSLDAPPSTTNVLQSNTAISKEGFQRVIPSRTIEESDQAIIDTAMHELKKLFAKREIVLKYLNSSCVNLGKIEYKLVISGKPVNIQEVYSSISSFKAKFEEDLKRLDCAVSAMHRLYSELAPQREMRSINEILADLLDHVQEEPSAKYDRIRKSRAEDKKEIKDGPKDTPTLTRAEPELSKKAESKSKTRVDPKKTVKDDPRSGNRPAKTRTRKRVARKTQSPAKEPISSSPRQEEESESPQSSPHRTLQPRPVPQMDPNDGKYHCSICNKVFLKQISINKHLEFDHPVSLDLQKPSTAATSKNTSHSKRRAKLAHPCQDCDKSFYSNIMLLIHRAEEHDSMGVRALNRSPRTYSKRPFLSPSSSDDKCYESEEPYPQPQKRGRKQGLPRIEAVEPDFMFPSKSGIRSESSSPESSFRSNWEEVDMFDPDIPFECSAENPVIPLKRLSKELVDAYFQSTKGRSSAFRAMQKKLEADSSFTP